jgi:PAS domain S-box-containing protein
MPEHPHHVPGADDALQRERDLLRTLIDNLPDHIYVKDSESRFLFNNAAHIAYLGARSQDELLGKTDLDVFPDGVGNTFFAEEREIIGTGKPLIGREERNVDSSGTEHWVSSTKVPRRDESGRIIGLVGMSRDITARIRAEQKLQQQNALLEEAARSEHAALEELKQAESHLVQSEKLAGLGQMVAGIAHEINNPLAFVNNNAAVAQRDMGALAELLNLYRQADAMIAQHDPALATRINDAAERIDASYTLDNLRELMARSREGLDRIRRIVNDLRDFARLDDSDLQDADLNAGIASTVNIIAAGAARLKDVQIEQRLASVIPLVACYPGKINQVVMNLLANAIDASPAGGKVTVESRATPRHVEIAVSDQGPGIDPAIRHRIFDPFFTTKAPGDGTGLGLSISYGIVREHGGEIDVVSEPGRGATFTVRIPLG